MRHSKWFKLAAEQGDDLSQKCMGLCYEHGDGVAVDKKTSLIKKNRVDGMVSDQIKLLCKKNWICHTI